MDLSSNQLTLCLTPNAGGDYPKHTYDNQRNLQVPIAIDTVPTTNVDTVIIDPRSKSTSADIGYPLNASLIKGSETAVTTSITTTTSSMPCTTVVTMTSVHTMMTRSSTVLQATTTTSTTTMTHDDECNNKESKRKKSNGSEGDLGPRKKQVVEVGQNTDEDIMHKMFQEMRNIKTSIDSMCTKVENVDMKVEQLDTKVLSMQNDNKIWTEKMVQIEKDLSDVKDSVEMAHNLIGDEKKERE